MNIREMLSGGKITSAGNANEVIELCIDNPIYLKEIFNLFLLHDPIVAMRSSYVFMKISKRNKDLIEPYLDSILLNLENYTQKEVRWHIPQILLIMDLSQKDVEKAYATLMSWAEGKDGNIVVYYSLESAYQIAKNNKNLLQNFIPRLIKINKTDAKIVKNRCKKIAKDLNIKLN